MEKNRWYKNLLVGLIIKNKNKIFYIKYNKFNKDFQDLVFKRILSFQIKQIKI